MILLLQQEQGQYYPGNVINNDSSYNSSFPTPSSEGKNGKKSAICGKILAFGRPLPIRKEFCSLDAPVEKKNYGAAIAIKPLMRS